MCIGETPSQNKGDQGLRREGMTNPSVLGDG